MSPIRFTTEERLLLWLVALGFFMQSLDATIVNTALPSIAASLAESPLRMQSAVVAYALTMAALIPASGWLADRFGTRRIFTLAALLFALGSLACALAPSLGWLVAARVLQGLGGALLLPVGRLAVLRSLPREKFLEAMSFVAIPGLMGQLLGPALGGWLVEALSWHWIFLINLPVGLLGAWAATRWMPDLRDGTSGALDLAGFAMLTMAMVCISLSVDGLGGLGFRHVTVLVLLLAGLLALAAYWLHAARAPRPLFAPSLFAVQSLRVGMLGNLFARIGSGAMPYMIPLLMQLNMGYSPAQAGMLMLPMALASMASKPLVTRLIHRHGYRRVLIANTLLLGLLIIGFALMTPGQPLWLRVAQMMVFGAVNSMQFTSMNTVTLKDLGPHQASGGNSMLSMVQMLGMGFGVAVAAALIAAFQQWLGTPDPHQSLQAFRGAFVCIGVVTMLSAGIFWQLDADVPQAGGASASAGTNR
ncbi:DHA2 family efflux MFS transporter permease subunit [Corticibacter populi]|uniref:DHA2 family efflux MFS transporter permease subunit n=2 Tax=Corticibacter populi TaxID=1550736 RepID=A0A3M6QUX1_9BURK|nr:DHA2 family efflux MFS transporter permease subunit [Corticibacter populi]RZS32109.1 EmrB/QacA subfamily drug resistance transporter [Corticibacter populi]